MRIRLVPYVPFGAKLAPLPDALEAQIVTPLGELPTASVHYHRKGVNAVVLDGITELGVEYHNGTAWVEAPNSRFLSMKGSFDHLEDTPTRNYSFVGVGWLLRQAKVWAATGLPVDADGKVQFLSANAGTIMATLVQNAKGRGWGAGVSVDFSATQDSSGAAWAKVLTIAYDLDLDLEAVLSNLYQQGVCDYRWEGRTLRIFNPDTTMGRDLTAGTSPLRLVVNDGQTSAPEDWTNEDLLTHAIVLGEDGKRWEFNNGANTPLGRLEKVITQGGVSDQGTASLLADQELLKGSQTRISYTREFTVTAGATVVPFRDYLPGDWVMGQRGTGFEKLRTYSLSLTVNADGVKGHAVLGDRLEDLLTKLAKRTKGITGGASAGGSGTRPAPEGPDKRTPATPTGLVVGVDAYIDDNGLPQGRVDIDWAHNGQATDGTAMTIDRHQVYYRINETGKPWAELVSTQDTESAYSPLAIYKADGVTREQYGFKVRSVGDNAAVSPFTAVVAVTMAADTTPPPVPEFRAQDLTTWLRTVKVTTTGKGAGGVTMPRDFSHFNVYQAPSSTAPGVLVDSKYGTTPGLAHHTGTMPLAAVWFYLTSVDRSGNESAASARQTVTPVANVDVDAIIGKIDADKVTLINVAGEALKDQAVNAAKLKDNAVDQTKLAQAINDAIAQGTSAYGSIPALTSSVNGKNTITNATTDANAVTIPGKVSGDIWQKWTTLASGGKLLKSWRWDGAAWVAELMDPTYLPQVDIGSGTFGSLNGGRIETNTLGAKQILVGDFQNFAIGSDFEDATAIPWALAPQHAISTAQKKSGAQSLRLAPVASAGTPATSAFIGDLRVKEGEQYYFKFHAYIDTAFNGTSNSKLRIGDQANIQLTAVPFHAITRNAWTAVALEATVTVPAGVTSLQVTLWSDHTAGLAYVDDIQIRRVSEASLIMNLGVEKLTASAASMGQAVIDKLYADVVRSKRITTDMMVVGRGANALVDEYFVANDVKAFRHTTAGGWGVWGRNATVNLNHYGATLTPGSQRSFYFDTVSSYDVNSYIPVQPGQKWLLVAQYTSDVSGPRATVKVIRRDGTTGYTTADMLKRDGAGNVFEPAGSQLTLERVYTVPADVTHIMPAMQFDGTCTSAYVYAGATFTNMASASLIVDGAVIARSISANAVTSAKIDALAVSTDKLAANAVTADKADIGSLRAGILTANVVDTTVLKADAITSKHTITGATFQTVVDSLRGIKISDTLGFMQYDASGNTMVRIGSGANNLIVGDLYTSRAGVGGIKLINSSAWGLPAIMYSYQGNTTAQEASSFMRYTVAGDPELVHRAPDRAIVGGTGLGFVRVEGDLVLSLGKDGTQKMRVEQPFNLDAWSPVDGYHQMTVNSKILNMNATNGNITLDAAAQYVRLPSTYGKTTGVAANVYIQADGGLFRSTSASKYKILPKVISPDEALLDVPMKDWIDKYAATELAAIQGAVKPYTKEQVERLRNTSIERIPGAIAEDVLAAGGRSYVTFNPDGEVEGLMYDRFALARTDILYRKHKNLVAQAKDLRDQVLALTGRVAQLEARFPSA